MRGGIRVVKEASRILTRVGRFGCVDFFRVFGLLSGISLNYFFGNPRGKNNHASFVSPLITVTACVM